MRKKQNRIYMAPIIIAILTLLLAYIFFINNSQLLIAQKNSSSNIITDNPLAIPPPPAHTNPSNPTAAFDSLLNPKVLLGSVIDQFHNSAKTVGNNNETAAGNATIFVINPRILLLSHQIIPPKDFILVYEAIPIRIINGQMATKLPCDSNSKSPFQILVGQLSEVKPAQLKLITALSQPGYMCMYHANLTSTNTDTDAPSKVPKVDNIVTPRGVGGVREGNLQTIV
jgi:hypothetical protein